MKNYIYTFHTKNFRVAVTAIEDPDVDLSWDESGEVIEKLNSGELQTFAVCVSVSHEGKIVGEAYLGGCIYESPEAFRDNIGIRKQGPNVGSYFSDMIREACRDARRNFSKRPKLRAA